MVRSATENADKIVVDGIGRRFGKCWAVRDVSLQLATGELVGLIGPSGSGKTTLLRLINGLELPDAGRISACGVEIAAGRSSPRIATSMLRLKVGMVFQHFNLWPYRTALENIMEGPVHVKRMRVRAARELAMEWATRFGISQDVSRYPGELSGGQRQRVAIARCAIMEPRFMLLDEITASLSPDVAGDVLDCLTELRKEGIGLLVVAHQFEFLSGADRVCFMQGGQILEVGAPSDVFQRPDCAELRRFVASVRHGL